MKEVSAGVPPFGKVLPVLVWLISEDGRRKRYYKPELNGKIRSLCINDIRISCYLHVSKQQLANIVSPFDDLFKTGEIDW